MKKSTNQSKFKPFDIPMNVDFPISIDHKKVSFLQDKVQRASKSFLEAKIYQSIVQNSYDLANDILKLNNLAPEVQKGNKKARTLFTNILEMTIKTNNIAPTIPLNRNEFKKPENIHDQRQKPCRDAFFIDIEVAYNIVITASHIAKNRKQFDMYLNAVEGIFNRGRCIDDLFHNAFIDDNKGISPQLGLLRDRLEQIAVNNKLYERYQELDDRHDHMAQPQDGDIYLDPNVINPGENDTEYWPPRGPGWNGPLEGCGGGIVSDPLVDPTRDPCEIVREICRNMVFGGTGQLTLPPINNVLVDNIDSINSTTACAGEQVRVTGHDFGNQQGENDVVINNVSVEIMSWSDTEIVIIIPDDTGPGCIGIRDRERENNRRQIFNHNARAIEELNEGLMCLGRPGIGNSFPQYHPTPAECTGNNFFEGSKPTIHSFTANRSQFLKVEPGADISLSWIVTNADRVHVLRISGEGPAVNIDSYADTIESTSHSLGTYETLNPDETKYAILAYNGCGSVSAEITVTLDQKPALHDLGIEVTQTIQHFETLLDHPRNNSVQMIAKKLTMVRVHLASGVTNGFNWGAGANVLPNITGILYVENEQNELYQIAPINPGQIMNAQIHGNRNNIDHSLNFILPIDLTKGTLKLTARVYQQGYESNFYSGRNTSIQNPTEVIFETKGRIKIVVMLFRDNKHGLARPTMADYYQSLQEARTRFPLAENGYRLLEPSGGKYMVIYDENLNKTSGWEDLLDRLDDIAFSHRDHNELWSGLVPQSKSYAHLGAARIGEEFWYWADNYPVFAAQKGYGGTYTHELIHTKIPYHANCPEGGPDAVDLDIPTKTDDIGMDVMNRKIIPAGSDVVMSYCGDEDAWISTHMWNRLRRKF